jgi:AcrR family transcriptional regulator
VPPGIRDRLLDAAIRLLDEGGVDHVTLREVGRLAGVSHNAPYKHFASKQSLLAATAARELTRRREAITALITPETSPEQALGITLRHYVDWALEHPARFKLTFGAWSIASQELDQAAHDAQELLTDMVVAAQEVGALPHGDPIRLAALLRALAHGAADLASTGHLAADAKGHADPGDLIDDMLHYLHRASVDRGSAAPDIVSLPKPV